jgi:hypothetical protein
MDVAASGPPGPHHLAAGLGAVRTEVLQAAAASLGISVDRLRAEVAAGTPLSDLAALASMAVQVVDDGAKGEVELRL